MRHPTDDELNDFHDGVLSPDERGRLMAHLAACTVCEDRSAALAELLDQLHGVPREIEPPAALWGDVRRAIEETPIVAGPETLIPEAADAATLDPDPPLVATPDIVPTLPRVHRRFAPRWMLAAAALLLVVVSSAITLLIVRGDGGPTEHERMAARIASEESLARFAELEAAYLRAAAELVDALEQERRSIPPDVAARAEQSLLVIDEAVRESRAALANDPDNAALAELTLAAHRRKLEFLQRVRQWSTES